MTEMGFKIYRMLISWSRTLSDDENEINQKGVDFYRAMFAECRKYDIEPIVTIFHLGLSLALEKEYGNWNNYRVMDVYVAHRRVLFSEFKEDVTYWLTYNEQNMPILLGVVDVTGDGGRVQNLDALYNQVHVQLITQAKAAHPYHELYLGAKIGPAPNITTSYPKPCNPISHIAATSVGNLRDNFYLNALVFGKYPGSANHYFGLNNIQICTEESDFECMRTYHPDFIGFNCYDNNTTEYLLCFEVDYEAMLHMDNGEVSYSMKLMDKPGIGRVVQNEYLMNSETDGHSFDLYRTRITARKLTQCYHLPVLMTKNGYGREDILEAGGSTHDS